MSLLAKADVCLDVCPTSNYLLSVVESLSSHPLPTLLKAGVSCTINSDDPLLFGCSLLDEYEVCRSQMGLSDEELARCARNSFLHCRAPESLRSLGTRGVEAWLGGGGDGGDGEGRGGGRL